MLEEALSSNTFPPADSALAMLSFVRYELPAGGANAEARFFRLFSLLCDRLFGPMAGAKENYQHEIGGWLSRNLKWSRPVSSSSRSPPVPGAISSATTQSIDYDPVVQLLASIEALKAQKDNDLPTLIEAISSESEHRPGIRYPFPLLALPKPTQQVVLELIKSTMTGKPLDDSLRENAVRLFGSLLLVRPQDQGNLKTYEQKQAMKEEHKRPLSLSSGLSLSPRINTATSSPVNTDQSEVSAKIMLSMLEFYLFTFIRYPLAAPLPSASRQSQAPPPNPAMSSPGTNRVINQYRKSTMPYGDQVYLHLFRGYLKHFLPLGAGLGPFLGFSNASRESELFLRIAIEFWFEGQLVIPSTRKAVESLQKRRSRPGSADDATLNVTLALSYDLVDTKYDPLHSQVQRCIRSLVNHVVKNPEIPRASQEFSEVSRSRAASGGSDASGQSDFWCLPPSMTILQPSFYNYVRVSLRYASVHVGRASFETAFDSWLVWLEPWNVEMRKFTPALPFPCVFLSIPFAHLFSSNTGKKHAALENAKTMLTHTVSSPRNNLKQPKTTPIIVLPKPTSKSKYTKKWEPYIAANLYLYLVPFAIFLRRARELDFSPKEFRRSLTMVQRVLRVYSPEVVQTINSLLSNRTQPLSNTVAKHEHLLGEFSPALGGGPLSFESCTEDMHNLLEEIYTTHMKSMRELDFFDRIGAYLGVGDVTAKEEFELKALVQQASVMVNFPTGYQVIPAEQKSAVSKSHTDKDERGPERQPTGFLTEKGVDQLVKGTARCNPLDVVPMGDPMYSRVKSYEVSRLVPLTIKASDWINAKLGFVPMSAVPTFDGEETTILNLGREAQDIQKYWFRINLRFLADYRTIVWICFLSWLYRFFH